MEKIPEEIQNKIRLIASQYYPVESRRHFRECVEAGYLLAQEKLSPPVEEIEKCSHDRTYSEVDGFAYCNKCGTPMQ